MYQPREGSKTEAVIQFLEKQPGQWASNTAICDACDTERKSLPSILKAAIDSGLIAKFERNGVYGYELQRGVPISVSGTPPGTVTETYAIPEFLKTSQEHIKPISVSDTPPDTVTEPHAGYRPCEYGGIIADLRRKRDLTAAELKHFDTAIESLEKLAALA